MKKILLFLTLATFVAFRAQAQFPTVTGLHPIRITTDTKDKPQSKIWNHGGKQWSVLATDTGAYLWRLDGMTWTNVLKLSPSDYGRADCKVMGNVTHILLFRGMDSHLVSVEYVPATGTYKRWSVRKNKVPVSLDLGSETATLDIDTTGRMWVAFDSPSKIKVKWSDSPYTNWSAPVTLATGVNQDDIASVIALPATGKIGVFWSDQTTRRFGFKTHSDGDNPANWSADEIPASQSALNIGAGMVDDHLNLTAASDGTLYAAVKTSYNHQQHPQLALLVRRPSGSWDNLYEVTRTEGTRPVVILNENTGKVKVVYTAAENGGDILYRESSTSAIAFGQTHTLIQGIYNYATSSKNPYNSDVVIMASDAFEAVSVLASEVSSPLGTGNKQTIQKPEAALKAFPNPFSANAIISFTLPEASDYTLLLQDLKGAKIRLLKQGIARARENNSCEIQRENLPAGIYLVRLQTNQETRVLRLLLTK